MILKLADFYYDTNMSEAKCIILVDKLLVEHLQENDELDLEHFIDSVEELEEFESAPDANSFDLEYSLNELELKSEEILDELEKDSDYDDIDEYDTDSNEEDEDF